MTDDIPFAVILLFSCHNYLPAPDDEQQDIVIVLLERCDIITDMLVTLLLFFRDHIRYTYLFIFTCLLWLTFIPVA